MTYKLIQTDAFQRDLDAVLGYIVSSLKNRPAAASLLDAIEDSYDNIERMPLMYEACHDPYLKRLGYRKVGIHNYIMLYRVDSKTGTVFIMRLFHGRQDYEKTQVTLHLSDELAKGRTSGETDGWLTPDEMRTYFRAKANEE